MYISNSNNIGMATLLQNNKNCMKTLTNGSNVVGGTAGTNHIIVGNVVNAQTVGHQSNQHQVGIITSTNVPTQAIATPTQGGLSGSNTATGLGGNLVLPAQTQTILLTNGTTGASTILTYQQYQQLLQQQQQQQQQRLVVSQNVVTLPIGNIISTGNSGLTVITDTTSNHNVSTSSGNTSTSQGTILVATSTGAPTIASSSTVSNSFQQQFQQQLSNLQNSQNVSINTSSSSTTLTTPSSSYLRQSGRLIPTAALGNAGSNNNNNNTTSVRHFSQFSQQQPANTLNVINNTSATPNNGSNQQQRTAVLINRNNNTIISSNTAQRLQHATILTKSANIGKTTQPQNHQGTIMVNNMAVQQVINNSNGQIISLVKTSQQQQPQQINKNLATKSIQQTITANLPQQQLQKHRYGTTNIQQIKQQQLKVVTTNNHQTIPQRATIINSNTITKTHVLNNSNTNAKFLNLNKATTTVAAGTITTNKNVSSNCMSKVFQKQPPQQQQPQHINGHLINNKLTNIQQQQPASKLVPNGHNAINNTNNTSKHFANSSASVALSSSSNTVISTSSSTSSTPTTYNTISTKTALNTSYMPITPKNPLHQYATSNLSSTTGAKSATHHPSNSPTSDPICVSHVPAAEVTTTKNIVNSNNSPAMPNTDASTAVSATNANEEQEPEPEPEIDIVINNVVCSFSVRCHLNLREIALNGANVEYRRENGMVTMKLRRPYTTASIWSSGRITCTGATSEEQAKIAARRYARCLEKLGFRARFNNFRVVNVLGTCSMPWAIKIVNFSEKYREEASYEPELHPGVTYKLRYPKATLKIFSTGSVTVTAASVAHVQAAIEHIYPLVHEFRKKRSAEELEQLRLKQLQNATFEDITEVEDVAAASTSNTVITNNASGSVSMVTTAQRRRISNTINKLPNTKRRRVDDINKEVDVDDPGTPTGTYDDEDDIVMYDPSESVVEGLEDEEDL